MNFQAICRICINSNSDMISIFESHNFASDASEIFKVIVDCASVQITKCDGFSRKICQRCLEHLSQAYSFKKLCEDSDYKFRNNCFGGNVTKIKNELYEEDTPILTHSELRNHETIDNKTTEFGLTHIKQEIPEEVIIINDSNIHNEENADGNTEMAVFVLTEVGGEKCYDKTRTEKKNDRQQDKIVAKPVNTTRITSSYKIIDFGESSRSRNPQKTGSFHIKKSPAKKKPFHMRLKIDRWYRCDICEQRFLQNSDLSRHIGSHTVKRVAEPKKICRKKYAVTKCLKLHLAGEPRFKCHICPKSFWRRGELMTHITSHMCENFD